MLQIIIEPTKLSAGRGRFYRVSHDGGVLIEETRNPEFDACRRLLALGITGVFETWRLDRPYPCMRIDIELGAKLSVAESTFIGPKVIPFAPLPESRFGTRFPATAGASNTGKRDFQASSWPPGDEGQISAPPDDELARPDLEEVEA